MKLRKTRRALWAIPFALPVAALAANEPALPEVSVRAPKGELSLPAADQPRSVETITEEGLRIYGGAAASNAYKALSGLPSVMFEGADAYGLSATRSIRSRGRPNSSQSPGQTYEGMPIRNLGGFTGNVDLFDLENVAALDFYRGAVPVDKGFGFANASGSVDMKFRRPSDSFGGQITATVGSSEFRRLFARVDTGRLSTDSSIFVSASHTQAEKWRGAGDAPKGRDNFEFGVMQKLWGSASLELFGVHNDIKQHNYRSLNHAQASDLGTYRDYDYNASLTGTPAKDVAYYDFNRQNVKDQALFGTLRFGDKQHSGFVKAYYWKIDGDTYSGSPGALGAPGVVHWTYDSKVYGLIAQADAQLYRSTDSEVRGLTGYWFHIQEPPGPPTNMSVYRIGSGGSLSFAGWSTLAKMSNHIFSSPYAGLQGTSGPWSWDAAVRYMNYRTPAITYYNGTGLAESSYDGAFSQNPATSADRAATSRRLTNWLPNVGASYVFSPQAKGYVSLGRNYGVPAFGIATAYNGARAQFVAAGTNLQSMWQKADQELSDNLDVGVHLTGKDWYLSPVLFATRFRNRAVQILDPVFGVAYSQNSGKAEARGIELEGGWHFTPQFSVFGGVSLSKFELSDDTQAASGVLLNTRGRRVADAPSFMAKLGTSYRSGGWTLTPTVRHIGARYGDALNKEWVAGYTVTDVDVQYALGRLGGFREATATLSVSNLTDRRYVAIIGSDDVNLRNGATYYPGAPRAVAATLSLHF